MLEKNSEKHQELLDTAYRVRQNQIRMAEVDGRGFLAQALGAAEIVTSLYFYGMNYKPEDPEWEGRDRFLMSAGHNAIAIYSAMAEAGFFPKEELDTYGLDESRLPQASMPKYTPGIEISGGSIGLGLPIAVGIGLGLKRKHSDSKVFVMMGDGELCEGPTWEAAMSASNHNVDNIIALVDMNGIQADGATHTVTKTEPIHEKFEAFGFYTQRINGNSIYEVCKAIDQAKEDQSGKPKIIICDTVPGTGVDFLIGNPKAHFISLDQAGWERAEKELKRGEE